jgi:hypothetical protein
LAGSTGRQGCDGSYSLTPAVIVKSSARATSNRVTGP